MVLISASARKELRKMGCTGPNFLRVSKKHNQGSRCGFFIDSITTKEDEIIHDGEIKVITDLSSTPFMHNLSIDFDKSGITIS
jgi:Fe-S cluster assembly iron-binding protein IscA